MAIASSASHETSLSVNEHELPADRQDDYELLEDEIIASKAASAVLAGIVTIGLLGTVLVVLLSLTV